MKARKNMDAATRALVEAGIDPAQFAQEKLKLSYQMFRYRIRHSSLLLEHYHLILHYTKKQFHEIWPSPFEFNGRQPIPLNLTKPKTSSAVADPPALSPPKEKKEEPPIRVVPPPSKPTESFAIIDIYGTGGMPTIESDQPEL